MSRRKGPPRATPVEVPPAVELFLLEGRYPRIDELADPFAVFLTSEAELRDTWRAHRGRWLRAWIRDQPGTRPWGWWAYDAPRWSRQDQPPRVQGRRGDWPEPRRRLGGTGTPAYEALNYAPEFTHGIPDQWITRWFADYYNGRLVDVQGRPIGTEYHEGHFPHPPVDPADPPVFESEPAYLARHGRLTNDERRRLPATAFAPEVITPPDDEDLA